MLYDTVYDTSMWNQRIIPFALPPHISLMLGDVRGGSSSSIMVIKQFLSCVLRFFLTCFV
jgi:phosphomevalonate kinase